MSDEKNSDADKIVGSTDGLERCPFCGESARIRTDGITVIVCDGCGIYVSTGHRSIGLIRSLWNTRYNTI